MYKKRFLYVKFPKQCTNIWKILSKGAKIVLVINYGKDI